MRGLLTNGLYRGRGIRKRQVPSVTWVLGVFVQPVNFSTHFSSELPGTGDGPNDGDGPITWGRRLQNEASSKTDYPPSIWSPPLRVGPCDLWTHFPRRVKMSQFARFLGLWASRPCVWGPSGSGSGRGEEPGNGPNPSYDTCRGHKTPSSSP